MFKKIMLLCMAVTAFSAFTASAAMGEGRIYETLTGNTTTTFQEIPVNGSVSLAGASLGGFTNCRIHANLTGFAENDKAWLEYIEITPSNPEKGVCIGSGAFTGCTLIFANMLETNGTVGTHDLTLLNASIDTTNDSSCGAAIGLPGALENVDYYFEEITLTPATESGTSLDEMAVSGGGIATTALGNLAVNAWGNLGALDKGRWAIETL